MATYDKEIDYDNERTFYNLKERHNLSRMKQVLNCEIYGSSRVGVRSSDVDLLALPNQGYSMRSVHYSIGSRTYELSNHLGNVLSVISDTAAGSHAVNVIPYFEGGGIAEMRADIRVAQDYSPFGVTLSGRDFVVDERYRYEFQGQEMDDEVSGDGNSYTAEFWQYSPRLGRRWNIDPVIKEHESPYAVFANNPVWHRDPNGAHTTNYQNAMKKSKSNAASDELMKNSATYKSLIDEFAKKDGKFHDIKLDFKASDLSQESAAGQVKLMYKGEWILDSKKVPKTASLADFSILVEIGTNTNGKYEVARADKLNTLAHELLIHANSYAEILSSAIDPDNNKNVNGQTVVEKYSKHYNDDVDHENLYSGKATLYNATYNEIINWAKDAKIKTLTTPDSPSLYPSRINKPNDNSTLMYWEILLRDFENSKFQMPKLK